MAQPMTLQRALFLDRDGPVIIDTGYPRDPLTVTLTLGAAEGLRTAIDLGYLLVVISNQSGVGRGIITRPQFAHVHAKVVGLLAEQGIALDGAYYCTHAPSDGCACRKPSPELLRRASRELGIDLRNSVMVGDRESDVVAGRSAGCKTVVLDAGRSGADFHAKSWNDIIVWLRALSVSSGL